jgi:hypothetical protein
MSGMSVLLPVGLGDGMSPGLGSASGRPFVGAGGWLLRRVSPLAERCSCSSSLGWVEGDARNVKKAAFRQRSCWQP